MMKKISIFLILFSLAHEAWGQSNALRSSKSHIGIGAGLFSYYGPRDLNTPATGANQIQHHNPGVVLLGSFPLNSERWFFRMMFGASNFTKPTLLPTDSNEFLRQTVFWFEPEVVYTLAPRSTSRLLPYIFSGFGSLFADPTKAERTINPPGVSTPGPVRSVFTLPLGAGVDVAITRRVSFFVEGSYRFNFNYVGRNEVAGRNPHNTSLLFGGIRIGLDRTQRVEIIAYAPPPPLPPPVEIPPYEPPIHRPMATMRGCPLVELNSVFFPFRSTEIPNAQQGSIDENANALRVNPNCCVEVIGYTDEGDPTNALRISQARATQARNAFVSVGISADRMRVRGAGLGEPCGKEKRDDGPGCAANRRVEVRPVSCEGFFTDSPAPAPPSTTPRRNP